MRLLLRRLELSIVSILLLCVSLPIAAAEQASWKVGIARAKITPEKPLWLAGYGGRDRPAEGTLHDLWIKVLALQAADGSRAAVVTADLLGFPREMAGNICAELKKQCKLERSQIMLTCSHTHTGPVLRDALHDIYPLDEKQKTLIDEYSAALEKKVVATVVEAFSQATPATLWAGEGETNFATNRRNNPQAEVEQILAAGGTLKGPVDHSVPVLAVRGPQGGLRAVLFGYACHCTTLASYEWSGDYAGFAQLTLEEDRPETAAMFFAGCGADQNPLPRRSVQRCRRYGRMLAAAVEETLRRPMRPIAPRLSTAFETIELAYHNQPTAETLQADAKRGGYHGRWASRLLDELDDGKQFATGYPYPVQAWKLGDQQFWIALGGEVVVDYVLRFKREFGPTTWVAGYTNDVMAYIPSRRVWEEGGYEAGAFTVYGLPTRQWTPQIEQRVVQSVKRLCDKVNRIVAE